MRIILDLQGCQLGISSLCFIQALLCQARLHEVWIALNGGLPGTVEPLRAALDGLIPQDRIVVWQPGPVEMGRCENSPEYRVAEQVREAFLASFRPDVIYVTGFCALGNVASIGEFEDRILTVVALDDSLAAFIAESDAKNRARRNLAIRRSTQLKRSPLLLAASDEVRAAALKWLSVPEASVLTIKSEPEGARQALEAMERLVAAQPPKPETVRKPKLAFVSPLPPLQSGIADYSAELLPALARYYEIEVVVDQPEVSDSWVQTHLPIRDWRWFDAHAASFDRVLYHMGNSAYHHYMMELLKRHPGTVVLHDFFLGHAVNHVAHIEKNAELWTQALYASHGYSPLIEQATLGHESAVWNYPACWPILSAAEGIIVHSDHSRELGNQWFPAAAASQWRHVPLSRAPAENVGDREAIRRALELEPDDFVVCSFGHLVKTKLNAALLEAWLQSPLAAAPHCKLVFVGQLSQDAYGKELKAAIEASPHGSRIKITGYAEDARYREYLAAADVGVQLRQQSRGETSAAVFDCMNYGMSVIVNAHGSLAELPEECVIKLPDRFEPGELATALVRLHRDPAGRKALGEKARAYVHEFLTPEKIAGQYARAIEAFAAGSWQAAERRLVCSTATLGSRFKHESAWQGLADAIALNRVTVPRPARQLLVDVTAVAVDDLKTGIQRVVRSFLSELLHHPPAGTRVEPVYRDRAGVYRYARHFTQQFLNCNPPYLEDVPVITQPEDIFFGLDLHAYTIGQHRGEFEQMRDRGVRLIFMAYDILPVLRPAFFPLNEFRPFHRWLETIGHVAYGIICISQATADELLGWLDTAPIRRRTPLHVGVCHLGADIAASVPTQGIQPGFHEMLRRIPGHRTFLMVGTVEPRKGHVQALAAFERLWDMGYKVMLVIVGKKGWIMDHFTDYVLKHPEFGSRLFWYESASDEMLLSLYENASALLMPSEGEGFGLPLIEAATHGLPIIARDMPVFREVSGEHAFYFSGLAPEHLAQALQEWLARFEKGEVPGVEKHPWLTWKQAALRLKSILFEEQWYRQKHWQI